MKKGEEKRTPSQNNAMHKLFSDIADEMLSQGIGMRPLLDNVELQVTPKNIKEVWRAVQIAEVKKESTADLTKAEVNQVWERMIPILKKTGLEAEFPSWDEMSKRDSYRHY